MWLVHCIEDRIGRMPESEHAVAAAIENDGTFEGDQPWPGTACCNVRIDSIFIVEIRKPVLRLADLIGFAQGEEFGVRRADVVEVVISAFNGKTQGVVIVKKIFNDIIGEAAGNRGPTEAPHFM